MANSNNIPLSVVMPVYNGARYLRAAIESIQKQTYSDYELIIIDDCTQDNSSQIYNSFTDERIRVVKNATNLGLAKSLNVGIRAAKGTFIARMDQDDLSLPDRFFTQMEYLRQNPKVGLVGTWAEIWNETAVTAKLHKHPVSDNAIRYWLMLDNPFVHSSVMMRKRSVVKAGYYSTDASRQPPEDYELWSRIANTTIMANIPQVLHIYRETKSSMSRMQWKAFLLKVSAISLENICHTIKLTTPSPLAQAAARWYHGDMVYLKELSLKSVIRFIRGLRQHFGDPQSLTKLEQRVVATIINNYTTHMPVYLRWKKYFI